ncbi:MAG: organic hydroperoxide resistance protein [Oceanospirillaceae bacterium]|nr:organic hydroperoxide resistance protein [Oceanospirillaceae bacterium]MCP5335352.1 organic hydroperoxide resistance protein [Oceanospirillaceae bacterium]MCP5350695.1 organic hydroperoxide resistance protein [Oceanospirillaceae bacterium]
MNIIYRTAANAKAGRNGQVSTEDGLLSLNLSYPKELGGSGAANNPEQLFAAGYAACFSNAVLHVARELKIKLESAPVRAEVGIGARADGGFALSVQLDVSLDMEQGAAQTLVAAAHKVCPYSHAVRGNITLTLRVNGEVLSA